MNSVFKSNSKELSFIPPKVRNQIDILSEEGKIGDYIVVGQMASGNPLVAKKVAEGRIRLVEQPLVSREAQMGNAERKMVLVKVSLLPQSSLVRLQQLCELCPASDYIVSDDPSDDYLLNFNADVGVLFKENAKWISNSNGEIERDFEFLLSCLKGYIEEANSVTHRLKLFLTPDQRAMVAERMNKEQYEGFDAFKELIDISIFCFRYQGILTDKNCSPLSAYFTFELLFGELSKQRAVEVDGGADVKEFYDLSHVKIQPLSMTILKLLFKHAIAVVDKVENLREGFVKDLEASGLFDDELSQWKSKKKKAAKRRAARLRQKEKSKAEKAAPVAHEERKLQAEVTPSPVSLKARNAKQLEAEDISVWNKERQRKLDERKKQKEENALARAERAQDKRVAVVDGHKAEAESKEAEGQKSRQKSIKRVYRLVSAKDLSTAYKSLNPTYQGMLNTMYGPRNELNKAWTHKQIIRFSEEVEKSLNEVSPDSGLGFSQEVARRIHVAHDSDSGAKLPANYIEILRTAFILFGVWPRSGSRFGSNWVALQSDLKSIVKFEQRRMDAKFADALSKYNATKL